MVITHWPVMDLLPSFGAVPTRARSVRDGTPITGGIITADIALTRATELAGQLEAEAI